MILRTISSALVALAIAAAPALACTGDEIYADDFAEDSGIWIPPSVDWRTISGGVLELKMQPGYSGGAFFGGSTLKDFDVCFDVVNADAKDPNATAAGLTFWFKDWDNRYIVLVASSGPVAAIRANKGRGLLAQPWRQYPSIKGGPGAKNSFRVTAKGNTVTVYGNNQRLFSFRGVPDDGYLGLFAQSEADNSNAWKFSSFKLAEPQ